MHRFVLLQRDDGRWCWQLLAPDGRPLARSAESFDTWDACADSINLVQVYAAVAPIQDSTGKRFDRPG
ncbi:MAG TPA: YegP family protein [Gaiellaceae bacterium]